MDRVGEAVELLLAHRESSGRILVVGDFDADGATSTALILRALRAWGFPDVDFLVPNRFRFGYGLTPEIVELAAGRSPALIVTVDSLVPGNRERDRRHGFAHQLRVTPGLALDALRHPRWLADVGLRGKPRMENHAVDGRERASAGDLASYARRERHPEFRWEDIARLRELWRGPLLIKGVLSADDARRAVAIGAEGVVVSNHGGRQLDGAIATLLALPSIVQAIGASATGEAGARRALEILRDETRRVLALLGCPDVRSLSPSILRRVDPASGNEPVGP
jgi:isopentenyl diphosphate isomerase/L-lactate dehydrogenase-like FMN-dependent dehydrogenase